MVKASRRGVSTGLKGGYVLGDKANKVIRVIRVEGEHSDRDIRVGLLGL